MSGSKRVTDGEIRRSFWHFDFMGMLTGLDIIEREGGGMQFHGTKTKAKVPVITGKLDFPDDHPMLEHFKFVAANTKVTPKISIPGPSCCHFRIAKADIASQGIPGRPASVFRRHRRNLQARRSKAFYDAGCRYLQMDDIFFAYLCDPKHPREQARPRARIPTG